MLRSGIRRLAKSTGVATLAILLVISVPWAHAADDYEPVVTEFLSLLELRSVFRL